MTHMELENLVSDYLEGQLDIARRVDVEAHLDTCPPCRELTAAVRETLALCRSAEDVEPAPWLVPKILRATVGERKLTWWERAAAAVRPVLNARVAYAVGMAVFSFSIIINVAGINLRHFKAQDLKPSTWLYQFNRNGHLLYARAEKFCYDLKVVYELETRLRQLRPQSNPSEEPKQSPQPEAPAGGSTLDRPPAAPQLAHTGQLEKGSWKTPGRSSELSSPYAVTAATYVKKSPGSRFELPLVFSFYTVSSVRSITR